MEVIVNGVRSNAFTFTHDSLTKLSQADEDLTVQVSLPAYCLLTSFITNGFDLLEGGWAGEVDGDLYRHIRR